jgi:large subunit ribosomal protein L9
MKVILLKDISKLGKRGDVKEVANGYAINVLIPKGQALQATDAELLKWQAKKESVEHKKELAVNAFLRLVETLKKQPLIIEGKKHDAKGQLFAAVKDTDIADVIFAVTSLSIDPKQIHIDGHIKTLGKHSFVLKQGKDEATFTVEVK